jgi:hypothetical protein
MLEMSTPTFLAGNLLLDRSQESLVHATFLFVFDVPRSRGTPPHGSILAVVNSRCIPLAPTSLRMRSYGRDLDPHRSWGDGCIGLIRGQPRARFSPSFHCAFALKASLLALKASPSCSKGQSSCRTSPKKKFDPHPADTFSCISSQDRSLGYASSNTVTFYWFVPTRVLGTANKTRHRSLCVFLPLPGSWRTKIRK